MPSWTARTARHASRYWDIIHHDRKSMQIPGGRNLSTRCTRVASGTDVASTAFDLVLRIQASRWLIISEVWFVFLQLKQSARKIEKPVVKIRSVSRKENPCVLTRGGVSPRDSSGLLFYLRSWFEVVLAAVCQWVCCWHCRLWLHSFLKNIFIPLFLFWLCWVFVPAHRLFPGCRARASLVVAHRLEVHGLQSLWHTGLAAQWHMESSWTGGQTLVPWSCRQILNHWTTNEVLCLYSWLWVQNVLGTKVAIWWLRKSHSLWG